MRASNHELEGLDPRLRPTAQQFVDLIRAAGVGVHITSVVRDRRKQAKLYAEFLAAKAAGRPHLPALPPGQSLHEVGLAWDMVTTPARALEVLGPIWESIGGQWGGRAAIGYDPVHFQAKQFLGRS